MAVPRVSLAGADAQELRQEVQKNAAQENSGGQGHESVQAAFSPAPEDQGQGTEQGSQEESAGQLLGI